MVQTHLAQTANVNSFIDGAARPEASYADIASLPGLPCFLFVLKLSMQNEEQKTGQAWVLG